MAEPEICICAAIQTKEGQVIRGHRHVNCMTTAANMGLSIISSASAQGFVTSRNRFVGREEGRALQEAAGIASVNRDGYRGLILFSEDLY